jgi:hypothetical protein
MPATSVNGKFSVRQLIEDIDINMPSDGCIFEVYDKNSEFCVGGMIKGDCYWGSGIGDGKGGMDSLVDSYIAFTLPDDCTFYIVFNLV